MCGYHRLSSVGSIMTAMQGKYWRVHENPTLSIQTQITNYM
jgi:hypothetical protein